METFIKKGLFINFIERILCIPLIPWLSLFVFFHRGPVNTRQLKFSNGRLITIKYKSLYSYLLQGVLYFLRNDVELIGPEGDGKDIVKPGVITRLLMQDLTLFPGRNLIDANRTYLAERHFLSDWNCLIRFLFLGLFIRTYEVEKDEYELLKVNFSNCTYKDTLDRIEKFSLSKTRNVISFVNAHCLNVAFENDQYAEILKKSDLVLPDGIGVQMGCRIKGYHLKDNVNGTDLFLPLIDLMVKNKLSVFLLGGTNTVNNDLIHYLKTSYPNLKIAGGHHGHFDHQNGSDEIIKKINEAKSDVLLVAFGVPRQEIWIDQNLEKINANVIMGVGGLFDFYSGKNKRAPQWIRELGFEWIYRIYQEPKRMWRRYVIGNPKFILRVISEKK